MKTDYNKNEIVKKRTEEMLRDMGSIFKELDIYPSIRGKYASQAMYVMGAGPALARKAYRVSNFTFMFQSILPDIKGTVPDMEFNIPEAKRDDIIIRLKDKGYQVKRPVARVDNNLEPHPYGLRLSKNTWTDDQDDYVEPIEISLIPVSFVEELNYADTFKDVDIDYEKLSDNPDLLDIFEIKDYQKDVIRHVRPKTFSEWVYVYGFVHNSYDGDLLDVVDEMLGADPLVFREDVYKNSKNVFKDEDDAYEFSEKIRKGMAWRIMEEELDYICSKAEFPYTKEQLKKVKYLFPEEHARTYCRQYFLILAKRYPELVTDGY